MTYFVIITSFYFYDIFFYIASYFEFQVNNQVLIKLKNNKDSI